MRILASMLLFAALLFAALLESGGHAVQGARPVAISRAEFVALISDYFHWVHWSEYNDYAKAVPRQFSDVPSAHRFAKQVDCALEERIIGPDENNKFYPDRPITRQDAAAILTLAFNLASPLKEPKPGGTLSRAEATALFEKVTAAHVAPVQVMPKAGTTSYRRYVNMTTPTPGATIYYTFSNDRTDPPDPETAGKAYDPSSGYLLFDNPNGSTTDTKYWTLKAVAKKNGLATSAVRTFVYYIVRPRTAAFEARLVHAPTAASPAVWDIMNPSDYNRPHVYYIEGTARGVVMDAGQYPEAKQSLKLFIDTVATKPYDVVLGHNNPDHAEQIDAFVKGGIRLFLTPQDRASIAASKRPDLAHAAAASVPIHDGDVLDLGNVQLTAYQAPGHSHGLVILQDKKNGWIFGTDMFGCNRPATADITNYSGAKMDLFLSMVQQLYANLRKNGGRIEEVYNAHNEVPVGYAGIRNFEAAVQQLIDIGDSVTVPSLRGADPSGRATMGRQRTSVVGDMWHDKNWVALWVGGNWGEPVSYLTTANPPYKCANTVNYNQPGGITKYSVLSNIEIAGGDLAGVDLTWAPPANGVDNTLPNKFDPWTYSYDVTVPSAISTMTVTPTAMSHKIASMTLNGLAISSGTPRTVAVTTGSRLTIDIVAPDGVTASHYVFTVKRP